MSPAPAIDAGRVVADLRELAKRTGDESGAQRVCWTQAWRDARAFLVELLDEIGLGHEIDEAGNLWARVEGGDRAALAVVVGSHVDSVPQGGWLDGSLGVMAALGVLRSWAEADQQPPRDLVLVDWADEEGARFGRSLFGSSAFSGSLDVGSVRRLTDGDGVTLPDALLENGVDLERIGEASTRREGLGAFLELHIEQGPVMEAEQTPVSAVAGCFGIERAMFIFSGQASHAGTTPMDRRRDAGLAAAAAALEIERIPATYGGVATTGSLELTPGIVTAIAGRARLSCDLRNAEAGPLEEMLEAARTAAGAAAKHRGCEVREELIWRIAPTPFDPGVVEQAQAVVSELGGRAEPLVSGALHDAAEVASVIPAAMLFVPSIAGISHAREEDTPDADLERGITALALLAEHLLSG
ncbi:Zn-dependent hydrolase [soil metagenome]